MSRQSAGEASSPLSPAQQMRQERMAILAHASAKELAALWQALDINPRCEVLRGPETGLIALRGQIGGGGAPFNFGEATVTRATVRMENGLVGHAIMLGRDQTKAKLAAVIDALATDPDMAEAVDEKILSPLKAKASECDQAKAAQTLATRVNFFTMVRGDD
ncbi:phosphonate C-P lyase system protein PhnG [uncultured Cohaesibacter sp.]|uniref:phosphonate C-P lyase system protein PhnG n=1 Tax=uncultured Cohaesibacter sp. TaxID=1002546 RepID=UPI003747F7AD